MAGGTPSSSLYYQVVSLLGRSAGLRYFEVEIANAFVDGDGAFQVGLTTDNPPATNQALSVSAGGAAMVWRYSVGYVTRDTPSFFNLGTTLAIGSVLSGAVNFTTGKIWMREVGNAWVGGGDPAADTSPTMTFAPGTWYIAACSGGTNNGTNFTVRLRTGAAQFTGAIPAGFSAWAA